MLNKQAIIVKAQDKLRNHESWLQRGYAQNSAGREVLPNDPAAVKFCLLAALHAAWYQEMGDTITARTLAERGSPDSFLHNMDSLLLDLNDARPELYSIIESTARKLIDPSAAEEPYSCSHTLTDFNDDPRTTHADILAVLSRVLHDEELCSNRVMN